MSKDSFPFEFKNIIITDDVRREISGKDILIGVYSGNIITEKFPSEFVFCVWMSIRSKRVGKFHLQIQTLGPSKLVISDFSTDVGVTSEDNHASFVLGAIKTELQQEGNISVRARVDDGQWQECYSIGVMKAFNHSNDQPNVSGQPSGQFQSAP